MYSTSLKRSKLPLQHSSNQESFGSSFEVVAFETRQKVMYLSIDVVCKIGDGIGRSEIFLSLNRTINNCYRRVKQLYPDANGMTMSNPCFNGCACLAEFNMTGWSGKSHQSCMFLKGNFSV